MPTICKDAGPASSNLGDIGCSHLQLGTKHHTFQRNGQQQRYIDPEGVAQKISKYFTQQIREGFGSAHGKCTLRQSPDSRTGPLFVNGPIKVKLRRTLEGLMHDAHPMGSMHHAHPMHDAHASYAEEKMFQEQSSGAVCVYGTCFGPKQCDPSP